MTQTRAILYLSIFTLVGMVGLYVGAYLAYQKYQAYQKTLADKGTVGGLLSIVGGG